MSDLIFAVTQWPTNGHMIEDCARLRYLRPGWRTIDPTYGKGTWWGRWAPDELWGSDLVADKSPCGRAVDFRDLPHGDDTFDAGAYDPPYVVPGGRTTTTMGDMHARYGQDTTAATPAAQQAVNDAGLAEMARVVRPGGIVVTKCADYVWSGRLVLGTHHTTSAALRLGLDVVDRWEHTAKASRAQPGNRTRRYCTVCDETVARTARRCGDCGSSDLDDGPVRQRHARRNLSTLLVLRVPKR